MSDHLLSEEQFVYDAMQGKTLSFSERRHADAYQRELERHGFNSVILLTTQDGTHVVSAGSTNCASSGVELLAGAFAFSLFTILMPLAGWLVTP